MGGVLRHKLGYHFLWASFIVCSSLGAFLGKSNIVRLESFWLQKKNQIQLNLFLEDGYGIQKGSYHTIQLYSLRREHEKVKTTREKIKQYGHFVEVKKRLSGITAIKNKKYFSSLKPLFFKKVNNNKAYAIQGKLFYCSFKDAFCSVQKFEVFIPVQ